MIAFRVSLAACLCVTLGCRVAEIDRRVAADRVNESTFAGQRSPLEDTATAVQPVAFSRPGDVPIPESVANAPEAIMPAPAPNMGAPWDGELSLEQLEEIALATNPSVIEARARVSQARGEWVQAGLYPNTDIGYSGQQLSSHGMAEQQGVYIGQEFVRGHKLKLNRAVIDQEIVKAEQLAFAQEQRVLTDVRLGYYEVLIAQRRTEVSARLVTIAEDAFRTAQNLFNAKDVSRIDVMRSQGALQMAKLLGKNAENQRQAAWSRLTSVLGTTGVPIQTLTGDAEDIAGYINQDDALQHLLVASPEIAAAIADVERARWVIDRAYAEPIPNIDVQAVLQRDNGTGSTNGNLQVSMPIPWLDHNQGGIRAAEAGLTAAEQAVARVELSLQRRLATVYRRYANARNQVEEYSRPDGLLDNSQQTLEIVRRGYEGGEIGYLDVLTAQTTFSQTNLTYIEALGELWAATVEIEGMLLKDSLSSGTN